MANYEGRSAMRELSSMISSPRDRLGRTRQADAAGPIWIQVRHADIVESPPAALRRFQRMRWAETGPRAGTVWSGPAGRSFLGPDDAGCGRAVRCTRAAASQRRWKRADHSVGGLRPMRSIKLTESIGLLPIRRTFADAGHGAKEPLRGKPHVWLWRPSDWIE